MTPAPSPPGPRLTPTLLATAAAEAAAAEEAFTKTFRPEDARDLVNARSKERELTIAAAAITDSGGPEEARRRHLQTPAVHAALAKGFADRIAALEKLVPGARKRLAERRAVLTEAGTPYPIVEHDPIVCAWRAYGEALTSDLAAATSCRSYSTARGEGREAEKFDSLYARLTAPLPQAPATP